MLASRGGELRTQISLGAIAPVTRRREIFDGRTIRVWWPNQSTGWNNFNWTGVINGRSVVHISACEATALPQPEVGTPVQDFIASARQRGAAVIGVRNVHPHDDGGGGVEFVLEVNWGSPLNIVTDITVEAPAEAGNIIAG